MHAAGLGRAVRALAAAALLVGGCAEVEVTQIGPKRPSRGANCDMEIFFSTPPPYPVADIASGRAMCQVLSGRTRCMEELKEAACRAGAHAMYGFSETVRADYNYVSATFGVQDPVVTHRSIGDTAVKAPPVAAVEPNGAECDPICSPGFACLSGQCIPQCNPPCGAGEICSRKRLCEPARGKLEPAKAATSQ